MKNNTWRTIAIFFMILFVLETIYIIWAWNVGTEMYEKEYECAYNICEDYDSFSYDEWAEMCYCYLNHELEKQIYLG